MSSSPLPYWIAALLTSSPDARPVPLVNPEKPGTVTAAALMKGPFTNDVRPRSHFQILSNPFCIFFWVTTLSQYVRLV